MQIVSLNFAFQLLLVFNQKMTWVVFGLQVLQ